jgi:histidine triad (HIT) family protein
MATSKQPWRCGTSSNNISDISGICVGCEPKTVIAFATTTSSQWRKNACLKREDAKNKPLLSKELALGQNSDCIFCRIVSEQFPAHIVYESENFICFLPIKLDVYGHTLVASKAHYCDIRDCPPELGADLFATVQTLFQRYRERIGATGFNLLNANGKDAEQSVEHFHFHFFPRFPDDGLSAWPHLPDVRADVGELSKLLSGPEE